MHVKAAILLLVLAPAMLLAQVSSPAAAAPASVASSLPQLQQVIENTRVDLAGLRVGRWKTDSAGKQQAEQNIASLQRNMTAALPDLMSAVRANPASLGASFKLYRNLNVLYDVLSAVAESAGAFGPKDEYSALATDVQNLDAARRTIGDQLETQASNADAELARIQAQIRQAQAAAAAAPPKRIVVDNGPEPKTTEKKKPVPKKKAEPKPPQ